MKTLSFKDVIRKTLYSKVIDRYNIFLYIFKIIVLQGNIVLFIRINFYSYILFSKTGNVITEIILWFQFVKEVKMTSTSLHRYIIPILSLLYVLRGYPILYDMNKIRIT